MTTNRKTPDITTALIQRIQEGTAPWQKPWKAGEVQAPMNSSTSREYNGFNYANLLANGYNDPRWLTFNQANQLGHKIKKGEKATYIRFVNHYQQKEMVDSDGNTILDENGKPKHTLEKLERPQVMLYNVFNASQIEGVEPYIKPDPPEWNPHERADNLITNLERYVRIEHNRVDSANFNSATNAINLPDKSQFAHAEEYYSVVLHEAAHWSRYQEKTPEQIQALQAEYQTPEGRAKEEVTAEMTSLMLCQKLGLDYAPQKENSLNYQATWAAGLEHKNNSYVIYGIMAEAEKRMTKIMNLEIAKELEKEAVVEKQVEQTPSTKLASEKTFLHVPYEDKNEAKDLGAKWDKDAKLWYAPEGCDLAPLEKWQQAQKVDRVPGLSPAEELAKAIKDLGGELLGHPIMDGKIQRIQAIGGKHGNKDFAYCAYNDEHPAGWLQNYRTDQKVTWSSSSGHELSEEQKQLLREQAKKDQDNRIEARHEAQNQVAISAKALYDDRAPIHSDHPYLIKKGVDQANLDGLKASITGKEILVPMYNNEGELRSLQVIHENGFKSFLTGGEKRGNFFVVGSEVKDLKKHDKVLIAEGLATAQSLNEATQKPCVVAFDAGNMLSVAQEIRQLTPEAKIYICADNDHHIAKNTGVTKAEQAAKAIKAEVVIPKLTQDEKSKGLKDFNDIKTSRGLMAVKKQIEAALSKKQEKEKGKSLEVAIL